MRPPKRPKLPGSPKLPRPPKPIDRLQALKPLPGLGQNEAVRGHWRFDERTRTYAWVKPHWRKP